MEIEVPTADWGTLFKEIPVAIQQLQSHEAHCSYEAAALLECALEVLHAVDPIRAYDMITQTVGELAGLAERQPHLPADTRHFMSVLADDHEAAFDPCGQQAVIERLSCCPNREQGDVS